MLVRAYGRREDFHLNSCGLKWFLWAQIKMTNWHKHFGLFYLSPIKQTNRNLPIFKHRFAHNTLIYILFVSNLNCILPISLSLKLFIVWWWWWWYWMLLFFFVAAFVAFHNFRCKFSFQSNIVYIIAQTFFNNNFFVVVSNVFIYVYNDYRYPILYL